MSAFALFPGHGVGSLHLGAGLYDTLTLLKVDNKKYPKADVSYSSTDPLCTPVIIELPENGLRLRFDGPQQRLRLIEIVDLEKNPFTVKNEPILQSHESSHIPGRNQLLYRRVYQIFGASYPGEFVPPSNGSSKGIYVVSYPGIALSFPLSPSKWSPQVDHAKMLAESGSAVASIAIFEGKSWAEARKDLFTRHQSLPQSINPVARQKEGLPDEIESVRVKADNVLEFHTWSESTVTVTLGETTAQDLVNDFGPPDTTYKRQGELSDATIRPSRMSRRRSSSVVPRSFGSTPSSISSTNTDTYDADFEEDDGIDGPDVVRHEDQYYCYFKHGFDMLLGPGSDQIKVASGTALQPVVTRVILHGNVPGSFEFNRHRRSRWSLEHVTLKPSQPPPSSSGTAAATARGNQEHDHVTSESRFPDVHDSLLTHFRNVWPEKDMRDGMVIVRDWAGDSPSGSAILIGDGQDDDEVVEEEHDETDAWAAARDGRGGGGHGSGQSPGTGGEEWLKNTQLYKFPGLMFEVMHNGAISALTVYEHPE